MKPHLIILLLMLTLPLTLQAAPDYTITNKHRVIEEVSLSPNRVFQSARNFHPSTSQHSTAIHTIWTRSPNREAVTFVFLATECPSRTTLCDAPETATYRIQRRETRPPSSQSTPTRTIPLTTSKPMSLRQHTHSQSLKIRQVALHAVSVATMTPQAVVIDTTGTLRYRGPIDDNRYETRIKHTLSTRRAPRNTHR